MEKTVFQNCNHTSVALHYLHSINERLNEVVQMSFKIVSELPKIDGIGITSFKNNTNMYHLK